jgi:hypothetical protein
MNGLMIVKLNVILLTYVEQAAWDSWGINVRAKLEPKNVHVSHHVGDRVIDGGYD